MTVFQIAIASAIGNFIAAAVTQSLFNVVIGIAVVCALMWSKA